MILSLNKFFIYITFNSNQNPKELKIKRWPCLLTGKQQPLLLREGVAEMAPMAVRALVAGQNHPANLRLVTRVPYHWAKLCDAVSKLAMISVWASSRLLPFVAELRLEHALVVDLQLQPSSDSYFLLSLSSTPSNSRNKHLLLQNQSKLPLTNLEKRKRTLKWIGKKPNSPFLKWID